MKSWIYKIEDSLFPRDCPICEEIVEPRGQLICRKCLDRLSFIQNPVCEKCGKEILSTSQRLCFDCEHTVKSFEKGNGLLNYDDVSRRCMVRIKYENRREDMELFARLSAIKKGNDLKKIGADYLVPVPVHKSRLRQRGYNQAGLLAERLSQELDIPLGRDFLVRCRKTAAQKELNPEERYRNLQEAFTAGNIAADAGKVILIDDIYTTGATIETCTRVLKAAGVKEVYFYCLCIGREIY